ncbi:MAG: NAD(P)H-dependent oxidoreductase [Deltaproteobacteria bacterium]|nr:NAD(P)H-dependent oxidoreductase [Deltaproteobacteria bacterium]
MKKILIAYISRAGHTQQMADYIAEGVRMAGCEAGLQIAATIKTEKDLAGYDGYIFGAPTYHRTMPPVMESFLFIAQQAGLAGKPGGAFGSYTHSGDAPLHIFDTMEHVFKMAMTSLGPFKLLEHLVDTPDGMRACQSYGRAIAQMLADEAL